MKIGKLLSTGKAIFRHGLQFDINRIPRSWTHVTKIDPEKEKKLPVAFPQYLRHTDAISVGGSTGVTEKNTAQTLALLNPLSTTVFQEPSGANQVSRDTQSTAAFLAIPQVINGDDEAFIGTFGEGVERIHDQVASEFLNWISRVPIVGPRLNNVLTSLLISNLVIEAYIIQNANSAAARESNITTADTLSVSEAKQRSMATEYVLDAEILYLEYSGAYAGQEGIDIIKTIDQAVDRTRVWYGGGISSREQATKMLDAGADAIVVGDIFHQIAEEEAELATEFIESVCTEDGLGSNPPTEPGKWLSENCTISDTIAASYLSTIPSIDDPIKKAHSYLAAGLQVRYMIDSAPIKDVSKRQVSINSYLVEKVSGEICVGVNDSKSFAAQIITELISERKQKFHLGNS